MESVKYDDSVAKGFLISTFIWGAAAMLVGVIIAFQLVIPALSFELSYLTFGRLRPLHTNAAIFGFALSIVFAGVYYSVPRMMKTGLWSQKLGKLHLVLYNLTIVLAALTLVAGISQSKEYAELEWPIDLLIAVWWVIFAVNIFGTMAVRKEKQIYSAMWFFIATIVTVPILFIVNNLAIPSGFLTSITLWSGVYDANIQWWYGHNAVAFVLTTPFLGLQYYFLPKYIDQPLFSHRLSILHFWALIFVYIWAGPHHLLYSPIPDWLQIVGSAFSIMLIAPSWGGMLNGVLTITNAKEKVATDGVVKFFLVAMTFYGMSTFEGPLMSIKAINSLSHYSDWTIGHVHSGALGWVAGMGFAVAYYLVPKLYNREGMYSEKLVNAHFWLATVGILFYVVSMWISGVQEGLMWRAVDQATGGLLYPSWTHISDLLTPYRVIRGTGGLLFLTGLCIMIYNVVKTAKVGKAKS